VSDPVEATFMKPAVGTLRVYDSPAALAAAAAELVCETAVRKPGPVRIALAGGDTPRPAYRLLAAEPLARQIPWGRVHWIFADERFVPHADPASNYAMARGAFLAHVPAPPENVHAVPTEGLSLKAAAKVYEATLQALYGGPTLRIDRPLFDLTLLGLGADGHTASLFPGDAALDEFVRWVVPVADAAPEARVTLTYPALDSSRTVAFLIEGADKREVLDAVLSGDANLPAGRIRPLGEVLWLVDRAAAGRWS
jgi:6-phosphogluconolactonase